MAQSQTNRGVKILLYFIQMLICFLILVQPNSYSRKISSKNGKDSLRDFAIRIVQRPYLVMIYINNEFHCTGVLLDEQIVLTAAHCFQTFDISTDKVKYLAGMTRVDSSNNKSIAVSKVIIHDEYNHMTQENDLAILKGETPLIQRKRIHFLGLPEERYNHNRHNSCHISGWSLHWTLGEFWTNLLTKNLSIFDQNQCRNYWRIVNNVSKMMICANDPINRSVVCVGDTSGPLVCNGQLVGFLSWGLDCETPIKPAVFTLTAPYASWMKRVAITNHAYLRSSYKLMNLRNQLKDKKNPFSS